MSVGLVVNPLIAGFAAISLMPARSAPSANSFTFRLGTALIALVLVSLRDSREDPAHSLGQRFYRDIRRLGALFAVAVVDEEIRTPRRLARRHVPPAVAHHEAPLEIDAEFAYGLEEHSRLRFAALAAIDVAVVADFDIIEREFIPKTLVNEFDRLDLQLSGGHVGLVGDDDVQKSGAPQ